MDPPADFETFYHEHHQRLLRGCYVLTGNVHEAEELTQDAFLSVWQRWDRVASMDEPLGYLFTTALNRHRSALRRVARQARRAIGMGTGGDSFAAADESDAVARALATLPLRQRQAIVLTDLLGYDSASAGRILGIKDTTVRALSSQARASLRMRLELNHD